MFVREQLEKHLTFMNSRFLWKLLVLTQTIIIFPLAASNGKGVTVDVTLK
jgi:hypothetical protein